MEKDPPRLDYDDEDGVTFWRKATARGKYEIAEN